MPRPRWQWLAPARWLAPTDRGGLPRLARMPRWLAPHLILPKTRGCCPLPAAQMICIVGKCVARCMCQLLVCSYCCCVRVMSTFNLPRWLAPHLTCRVELHHCVFGCRGGLPRTHGFSDMTHTAPYVVALASALIASIVASCHGGLPRWLAPHKKKRQFALP